jgi:hypothetical protein
MGTSLRKAMQKKNTTDVIAAQELFGCGKHSLHLAMYLSGKQAQYIPVQPPAKI